jgi:hypothetical protein
MNSLIICIDRGYIDHHAEHVAAWNAALRGSAASAELAPTTQELTTQTDAALVSASACDRYGNKAGSSEATLGHMYLFDTTQFGYKEPPNAPRFLISNAVWRKDPPLLDAVEKRLTLLRSIVDEHNAAHQSRIHSVTIHAAVLGGWNEYPEKMQMDGINLGARLLRQWVTAAP